MNSRQVEIDVIKSIYIVEEYTNNFISGVLRQILLNLSLMMIHLAI